MSTGTLDPSVLHYDTGAGFFPDDNAIVWVVFENALRFAHRDANGTWRLVDNAGRAIRRIGMPSYFSMLCDFPPEGWATPSKLVAAYELLCDQIDNDDSFDRCLNELELNDHE